MIFKSEGKQGDLNGFLDGGSHLQGELRFDASFRVDGKLTGLVESQGDLIVGEAGEVDGEVRAGQVFVSGTVKGTIHALRKVQIAPSGKVFAEIDTPRADHRGRRHLRGALLDEPRRLPDGRPQAGGVVALSAPAPAPRRRGRTPPGCSPGSACRRRP